jgi:hypothetical protein
MVGKLKKGGSYFKSEVVKLANKIGFFFISLSMGRGKD